MRRIATLFLVSMVLAACSPLVDSAQQAAQAKFQRFLANRFGQSLQSGIDSVIGQLSMKGGYLDDPLVRILLPPPLGAAIGIARDLQQNPQEKLLEVLINQAAENTVPVAGPILKTIVTNMDTPTLTNLLDSGNTAATQYLREKGGALVEAALLPALNKELHANGAIELYGDLLKARETAEQITATAEDARQQPATAGDQVATQPAVRQGKLTDYIADRAMSGLFEKLGGEEISIRSNIETSF